jgi:hypothetical protein
MPIGCHWVRFVGTGWLTAGAPEHAFHAKIPVLSSTYRTTMGKERYGTKVAQPSVTVLEPPFGARAQLISFLILLGV